MADPNETNVNGQELISQGGVLVGPGNIAFIRIPIPGSQNLYLELNPPPYWKGSSSSAIFMHDASIDGKGERSLRLDYGFNKATGRVDYHWNRTGAGTYDYFKIKNHEAAGATGAVLYRTARAFRYVGRTITIVGKVADVTSIVTASDPVRRAVQVASAWRVSKMTAVRFGSACAAVGKNVGGVRGAAIGGIVCGVVGGVVGYYAGEKISGYVYDETEQIVISRWTEIMVPETSQ
jgi:hypothetical protein